MEAGSHETPTKSELLTASTPMEEDKSESADNKITSVEEMLNGKFFDQVRASLQPTTPPKMAVWVPYTEGTNSNDTPSQPDTAVAEPAQPVADTLNTNVSAPPDADSLPSDTKDTRQLALTKNRDADRARASLIPLAHSTQLTRTAHANCETMRKTAEGNEVMMRNGRAMRDESRALVPVEGERGGRGRVFACVGGFVRRYFG